MPLAGHWTGQQELSNAGTSREPLDLRRKPRQKARLACTASPSPDGSKVRLPRIGRGIPTPSWRYSRYLGYRRLPLAARPAAVRGPPTSFSGCASGLSGGRCLCLSKPLQTYSVRHTRLVDIPSDLHASLLVKAVYSIEPNTVKHPASHPSSRLRATRSRWQRDETEGQVAPAHQGARLQGGE